MGCRPDQLVVIMSPDHKLAGKKKVTMAEVCDQPFIAREEGSGTRKVIMDYMKKMGLDSSNLNVNIELGSSEAIKGAVEAGMGISILSRATIGKELALGSLTFIELDPPLERTFSFVHQRQKFQMRVMEELLSFAQNYCEIHNNTQFSVK